MPAPALREKLFTIDARNIQKALSVYKAVSHSLRLQIMEAIHKAGTIDVTSIIQQLKLERPLVSAHLKILRANKIVSAERKGKKVLYSINYSQVNRISMLAERLVPYLNATPGFPYNPDTKAAIKPKEGIRTFTPMEVRVIRLICEENSIKEIAVKLGMEKRTVTDCRSSVIKKMKVRNSVGILFFAIKNGLFKV